ncbi:hypothetical protein BZL30_4377 [Mycobacterium kansasii]|uniref:Uncharacterized protein n=1 Tax=Mycobacterium kansasii TaxID=1768 RepID=A0A1V3X3E7_MYCKA|nr:hypothetical protein BZL30_4377 [Mycobacterium kansasii]
MGIGWLVSRMSDGRKRAIAATVAVSMVGIVIVVETDRPICRAQSSSRHWCCF